MSVVVDTRDASLGRLPFSLGADELEREATRLLDEIHTHLEDLKSSRDRPTIASFLLPLDELLVEVRDLGSHTSLMFSTHPDEACRQAARRASEAADRFFNAFRVDPVVYERLRSVDLAGADAPTKLAVDKLLREMRRAGVELAPEERMRLIVLSNEIDETSNQFMENVAKGQRTLTLDGVARLVGLPPDYVASHPPSPSGEIRVTTSYPDVHPIMAYCDDAESRRRVLHEFLNVAYPENVTVLGSLLRRRHELARRLGYKDYAGYATEDKMMERPEAVTAFLERLRAMLAAPARGDLARTLARKRKDVPAAPRLELWDASFWSAGYYDTKLRQETYGVDPRALRAYLPYAAIRDGLFGLCGTLFGLTFERRTSTALWHPSVEAYDVFRNGVPLGRCYFDLVPRPGKYNHAACFGVREGVRGALPQSALVCNFLDPSTPAETARMEYRDVVTFFHEFGHLLHALLSGHGAWLYNTMGSLELDFIEAPSQLFEEWARDPATLARFARNPDTGEAIPAELVQRLKDSEAMGRAARELRQVALASIALDLYERDPEGLDTTSAFREVWDRCYPAAVDPDYHPQVAWGHLTGYSACYYTYLWSSVIARDLLTPFHEAASLTDPVAAARYAREILEPGGARPAAELVRRYLGREFRFDAYERWALAGATDAPPASP